MPRRRRYPRQPIDRSNDALLLARLQSCELVEVEYVEHVRYDGFDYYLAHSLLEDLMADASS